MLSNKQMCYLSYRMAESHSNPVLVSHFYNAANIYLIHKKSSFQTLIDDNDLKVDTPKKSYNRCFYKA